MLRMLVTQDVRVKRLHLLTGYTMGRMRYESHAYGTREEIIKQLTDSGLTPGRSDRRMRELARAVVQLEEGDDTVTAGHTTYHVTDE